MTQLQRNSLARISRVLRSDSSSIVSFRLLAMALSFGANILALRLVTNRFGVDGFTLYAFLSSIIAILPFADLGLGASVVNFTADWRAGRLRYEVFAQAVRRVFLILVVVATSLAAAILVIAPTVTWEFLLGSLAGLPKANAGVTYVFLLTCLTIPTGIGARLLQGLSLTRVTVAWGIIGGPLQAIALLTIWAFPGFPYAYYALATAAAIVLMNVFICWSAIRHVKGSHNLIEPLPLERQAKLDGIFTVAAPYFVVLFTTAVFLQSGRVVLAHVSGRGDAADFALVAQFAAPVIALLGLISQNLWPQFRALNGQPEVLRRRVARVQRLYIALGLVLGALLVPAGVVITPLLVGPSLRPNVAVLAWAGVFLVCFSALRPVTMLLSSPRGIGVQAVAGVCACVANVPVTAGFSEAFGAPGAYMAPSAVLILCQGLPLVAYARRTVLHHSSLQRP